MPKKGGRHRAAAFFLWRSRCDSVSRMNSFFALITMVQVLLVAAAIFDLSSFTIPNLLNGSMFALFFLFLLVMAVGGNPVPWTALSGHFLAGGVALTLGMGMFAFGWIGGGDAKLFAVVCLWLGWDGILDYAVVASLLGGVLTVALIAFRRVPLPPFLTTQPWIARLADHKAGIPYGIALAAAGLYLLPTTEFYRLAITG